MYVSIELTDLELLVKNTNSYYYPAGLTIVADVIEVKRTFPIANDFDITINEATAEDYDGLDKKVFLQLIEDSIDIEERLVDAYPEFL